MGYSTAVIYGDSDDDHHSGQKRGKEAEKWESRAKQHAETKYFHILLFELRSYFDQTEVIVERQTMTKFWWVLFC